MMRLKISSFTELSDIGNLGKDGDGGREKAWMSHDNTSVFSGRVRSGAEAGLAASEHFRMDLTDLSSDMDRTNIYKLRSATISFFEQYIAVQGCRA